MSGNDLDGFFVKLLKPMPPLSVNTLTTLVQVFNMRRSLAFYRDVLGFEVVSDSGDGDDSSWVWIQLNGLDLMLNDQYEPGFVPSHPPAERTRWHYDTCFYFGCPDPDAVFEYLRSREIDCEPPIETSYGMKQVYVSDPDNYNLCFQCPTNE